jgi:hypothetical protein
VVVPETSEKKSTFIEGLQKYLDEWRLLTTRLHVVEPNYVPLKLKAQLYLEEGVNPKIVGDKAKSEVEKFFHPLNSETYWNGKGWPFGQNVYISELYQLLDRLPGVDYVRGVNLEVSSATTTEFKKESKVGSIQIAVYQTEGFAVGNMIRIDPSSSDQEYHIIAEVSSDGFKLVQKLEKNHALGTTVVNLKNYDVVEKSTDNSQLLVNRVDGLAVGDKIRIFADSVPKDVKIKEIDDNKRIILEQSLDRAIDTRPVFQIQSWREVRTADNSLTSIILNDNELVAVQVDNNSFTMMEQRGGEWKPITNQAE